MGTSVIIVEMIAVSLDIQKALPINFTNRIKRSGSEMFITFLELI